MSRILVLSDSLREQAPAVEALGRCGHEVAWVDGLVPFPELGLDLSGVDAVVTGRVMGVDGAALTVERIVLPPEAEEGLPEDADSALAALLAHPQRQDVRLAVGVLRGGPSWCAVRQRADDRDDAVGQGEDVVPGLVEGLRATFA